MNMRVLIGICLGVVFLVGCDSALVRESSHDTLESARNVVELHERWIPGFLPGSVTNVRLRRHLDSGESWLRFDLSAVEAELISKNGTRLDLDELRLLSVRQSDQIAWWHPMLQRPNLENAGPSFPFAVFRVNRSLGLEGGKRAVPTAYVALDPAGQAYYWQEGS